MPLSLNQVNLSYKIPHYVASVKINGISFEAKGKTENEAKINLINDVEEHVDRCIRWLDSQK